MCGIIGAFNRKDASEIIANGLVRLRHRGRDGCGVFDGENLSIAKSLAELEQSIATNQMAHVLHSIIGHHPQPLVQANSSIIANCEIYNWKTLCEKYSLQAKNDAELLHQLCDKLGVKKTLEEIHGVYAFCYWKADDVWLARDILGIKPLWINTTEGLVFSSERKALPRLSRELNPRTLIQYNLSREEIAEIRRDFLHVNEQENDLVKAKKQLRTLLENAIRTRIPERKAGLLFSGGIDSVVLAKLMKDIGYECTCYTIGSSIESLDVVRAKEAAEQLGLTHSTAIISEDEVEAALSIVVPLIEDSNPVKVSIALTTYFASKLAIEDGNKVIFTGVGADEIFAGYKRSKKDLAQINKDCYSDLLKHYEKNAYRDDVVCMWNGLELRVPYLDKDLVDYALTLQPSLKLNNTNDKFILRELARDLEISESLCSRPKKAAQYGSGMDKLLGNIAKKHNTRRSALLRSRFPPPNVPLAILLSSGKDGLYASYIMQGMNYALNCAVVLKSKNKDSFMFHTPNIGLAELQAKSMNIPCIVQETSGDKEAELSDLREALRKARDEHACEGVVSGAIASNYQRTRIERIADELGLKIFAPLWHIDQEHEMRGLIKAGFKIILSSIAADGLDKTWLGRELSDEDVDKLVEINKKNSINIAGEGGEFESLVLACPLFNKNLLIEESYIEMENEYTGKLLLTKASLNQNL